MAYAAALMAELLVAGNDGVGTASRRNIARLLLVLAASSRGTPEKISPDLVPTGRQLGPVQQ